MAQNRIGVVDGDGHVMENWDELLQCIPELYIKSGRFKGRILPPLDLGALCSLAAKAQADVGQKLKFSKKNFGVHTLSY
jgi:hypothetical protein